MSRKHFLDKDLKQAQASAAKDFANHVVVNEGEGRWYFGKPGTGMYHARIISAPGALIVYGDIGEVMFKPYDRDVLNWLSSCLSSKYAPDYSVAYVAEKVPHDFNITEFSVKSVHKRIKELKESIVNYGAATPDDEGNVDEHAAKHVKDILAMAKDLEEYGTWEAAWQFYERWWYLSAKHKVWMDDAPPDVEPLSYSYLFKVEMLRYFLMRINEAKTP